MLTKARSYVEFVDVVGGGYSPHTYKHRIIPGETPETDSPPAWPSWRPSENPGLVEVLRAPAGHVCRTWKAHLEREEADRVATKESERRKTERAKAKAVLIERFALLGFPVSGCDYDDSRIGFRMDEAKEIADELLEYRCALDAGPSIMRD